MVGTSSAPKQRCCGDAHASPPTWMLIVTKILAGRAKDLEDVRTVLTRGGGKLDIQYIRSVLETLEQALGKSDLLAPLQSELDRLSP